MIKKVIICILALAVVSACSVMANSQTRTQETAQEKHNGKLKKQIRSHKKWSAEDPVTVKLNDGTKVKGYIAEVADDHFVLTDRSGRQPQSIEYSQVKDFKEGLGFKSIIGLGVGLGVLAILGVCVVSHGCVN